MIQTKKWHKDIYCILTAFPEKGNIKSKKNKKERTKDKAEILTLAEYSILFQSSECL